MKKIKGREVVELMIVLHAFRRFMATIIQGLIISACIASVYLQISILRGIELIQFFEPFVWMINAFTISISLICVLGMVIWLVIMIIGYTIDYNTMGGLIAIVLGTFVISSRSVLKLTFNLMGGGDEEVLKFLFVMAITCVIHLVLRVGENKLIEKDLRGIAAPPTEPCATARLTYKDGELGGEIVDE